MDKGDDSDQFHHLRNLHKLSHKISKPTRQLPPHAPPPEPHAPPHAPPPPQQQQQPPVYNINKNDFREVVQKLTGSPAHDRVAPPPPPPKPGHSSRLHRIRPPPLAQISPRPPPMLTCAAPLNPSPAAACRPPPMSPLPPFPAVHAAAESPISAYMRFLQSSSTAPPLPPQSPLAFGCLPSPLFSPSGLSGYPVSPVPSPGRRQTQV